MGSNIETTQFQYSWILWYHDPENKDYSLDGYIKIADFNNPQQFWTIVDSISKEAWESGMFFFMKRGYNPMWESKGHENGGSWSKKIDSSTMHETFINMMVHCLANQLLINRAETLTGITVSPKGPYSIIRIWNTTTSVSKTSFISSNIQGFEIGDDVAYTAHKARPK